MRFKLEDNTQEAFQFLFLGAAAILIVRIVIGGIGLWLDGNAEDELQQVIASHRNGYLLRNAHTIVIGGVDIAGRLAIAFVMAIVAGILFSLLTGGIAVLLSRAPLPAAVQGARFGLLIFATIGVYTALFLPAKTIRIDADGIIIRERPALPGGAGVPIPAKETIIPSSAITNVYQRSIGDGESGCGVLEDVAASTSDGEIILARISPSGTDCDEELNMAKSRNARTVDLFKRHFAQSMAP